MAKSSGSEVEREFKNGADPSLEPQDGPNQIFLERSVGLQADDGAPGDRRAGKLAGLPAGLAGNLGAAPLDPA